MNLLHAVRELVVTLAMENEPEPGQCREWTGLHVEIARAQGVSSWLSQALGAHPEVRLPIATSRAFETDYKRCVMASIFREASLNILLDTFERSHVPVALLKGTYLAEAVYTDPALRPMCDVDLLTHEEDFERASHLLESLGYWVPSRARYADSVLLTPAVMYIHRNQSLVAVDLHRGLRSMDHYFLPPSVVWNEAVATTLHGYPMFFLTPELNFIHFSVHTLNHSGRLRDWLDLTLLSRAVPLDWDRIMRLTHSLNVVRPVFWVLQELSRNWGLSVPTHTLTACTSYVPYWLEDKVIHSRARYFWRFFSRLRLLDGWPARLRYMGLKLFPSKAYRKTFSSDTRWSSYFRARLRHLVYFLRDG